MIDKLMSGFFLDGKACLEAGPNVAFQLNFILINMQVRFAAK